jgi:hypothetical protein
MITKVNGRDVWECGVHDGAAITTGRRAVAPSDARMPISLLPFRSRSHRVRHRQAVCGGEGRGQQIVHTDRSMSARPRQLTLCVQRNLPVFVIGRQVFVSKAAVVPHLLVLSSPAGAVERFGIQWRRRRHDAALDQGRKALGHIRIGHPRGGAGVDEEPCRYRHT